ncbi:T-cell-specific guanine nucleotide triphosphate-binding protein 2-like isoform X2 [Mya arenaria]|uniref:T-cell-specific guanine nucleotide triphosphate-binding protein 2-like isoform X2 n=1 Tax=Mya arenaria TaxID=6604 RepID=UPI0022E138CC|nr:T-cell-specific guanine nucleotide triphosphate-binding protein 2-like isoform X2 [Mya arenaria]
MFCPGCGKRPKESWKYCLYCGTTLPVLQDESGEEEIEAISSLNIQDDSESDEEPSGAEASRIDAGRDCIYFTQNLCALSNSEGELFDHTSQPYKHRDNNRITQKYEDYELGSDFLDDLDMISDEETEEYKQLQKETGYAALREKLEDTINGWKKVQINIAVTGEVGAGKSSFINSIRGLMADDPGAADVGAVKRTLKPTSYAQPDNPNLQVWDLPGVGTSTFTRENYLQEVGFSRFDFVLLLSSSRFKENDIWLAKEILRLEPNFNLFFVRTKIDDDLRAADRSRRKIKTAKDKQELLQIVKRDVMRNLLNERISNAKIYLIDNNDTNAFEFSTIVDILIQKVSALKREAMIMSLPGITNEVVQYKLAILKSRISSVTKPAAIAAVYANTDTNKYPAEIEVLLEECRFYRSQLGLNTKSLEIIAKRLEIELKELLVTLSMKSYVYVDCEDRFAQYYSGFEKVEPSKWYSLPLIGNMLKVRTYQRQFAVFLKTFLDMCARETHDLQMHMVMTLE